MCILAAVSGPNFTLIVSDTRWSLNTGVIDAGAKIRRVTGGWAGATGSAPVSALGLRRLHHGLGDAATHVAGAYNEVAEQLVSVTPSCFFSARDDGTLLVNWTSGDWDRVRAYGGRVNDAAPQDAVIPPTPGGFSWRFSLPPGVSRDDEAECAARFKAAMTNVRNVDDIVAAVAAAFVFAYERDSVTMSAELECGLTVGGRPLHLRCPAVQAARGVLRFTEPPLLPPWPQLEPERAMFSLTPERA